MATTRSKFRVRTIEYHDWATEIFLYAVYEGSPENEKFFEATPAGDISITIKNEIAAAMFQIDQEVYVDFTPIEPTTT